MHRLLTVEYAVLKGDQPLYHVIPYATFPFRFSQIQTHHIHMRPYMDAKFHGSLACPFMKVFSFFISHKLLW
jgi:hypothetical protein